MLGTNHVDICVGDITQESAFGDIHGCSSITQCLEETAGIWRAGLERLEEYNA